MFFSTDGRGMESGKPVSLMEFFFLILYRKRFVQYEMENITKTGYSFVFFHYSTACHILMEKHQGVFFFAQFPKLCSDQLKVMKCNFFLNLCLCCANIARRQALCKSVAC